MVSTKTKFEEYQLRFRPSWIKLRIAKEDDLDFKTQEILWKFGDQKVCIALIDNPKVHDNIKELCVIRLEHRVTDFTWNFENRTLKDWKDLMDSIELVKHLVARQDLEPKLQDTIAKAILQLDPTVHAYEEELNKTLPERERHALHELTYQIAKELFGKSEIKDENISDSLFSYFIEPALLRKE